MDCKRVNYSECRTRLVVKNHVQGVEQYIIKMDRTLPLDMNNTNPFASLHRQLIEHQNLYKEGQEVAQYILRSMEITILFPLKR